MCLEKLCVRVGYCGEFCRLSYAGARSYVVFVVREFAMRRLAAADTMRKPLEFERKFI